MKARKRSRHIPIEIKNPRIVAKRVLKKVILSICQFVDLFVFVETAFLFAIAFPPPTSGTKIFTFFDSAGTRSATYADKTFVVQYVVRNVVCFDNGFSILESPVEYRIVLKELLSIVPLEYREVFTGCTLVGTEPCDPYFFTFERSAKRFYLADVAALFTEFY